MGGVRLGTSGWSYPEWVGHFYPNGTSGARMLEFYGHRFDTVEAHSTYRRLPSLDTVDRWRSQVGAAFRFVPKAHMGVTHRRDLDGLEDRTSSFLDSVAPLGERLGPVLVSLPQKEPDLGRLDRLLAALCPLPGSTGSAGSGASAGPAGSAGSGVSAAVAFDLKPGWATAGVIDRLDAHGASLVVTDDESTSPTASAASGSLGFTAAPLVYVRLRRDRYNRDQLEQWADRLTKAAADGREVFAFLKHDELGEGARYARQLQAAIRRRR